MSIGRFMFLNKKYIKKNLFSYFSKTIKNQQYYYIFSRENNYLVNLQTIYKHASTFSDGIVSIIRGQFKSNRVRMVKI